MNMKNKYNLPVHIAILFILLILYFIIGLLYESIMLETSNYGKALNMIIIGIAELFYFPFNTIFNPSSDMIYFIGIFINLNIYTAIIYFLTKTFLRKLKALNLDSP